MTTIRALLTPSEKSAAAQSATPASPTYGLPAVVLGGNADSRLLLRGLLRLHRHPVLLEAETAEGIDRLPATSGAKILVLDAGTEPDPAWAEALASVLRARPDLRALVILPRSEATLETRARTAGARAILIRPFAIREFVEAVDSVGTDLNAS